MNREAVHWCFRILTVANSWLLLVIFIATEMLNRMWNVMYGWEGLPYATQLTLQGGVAVFCLLTLTSLAGCLSGTETRPPTDRLVWAYNVLVLTELFILGLYLFFAVCLPGLAIHHHLGH